MTGGRVNGNLNLSRSIGDLEYKKQSSLPVDKQIIVATPDVTEHELSEDDKFMYSHLLKNNYRDKLFAFLK